MKTVRMWGWIAALGIAAAAAADGPQEWNWPRWRGADNTGASAESNWNAAWPEEGPPLAWQKDVGPGFSTPVISGGKLYAQGFPGLVTCLDQKTGEEIWKVTLPGYAGETPRKNFAAPTPWVEDDAVYIYTDPAYAARLDTATGKVIWHRDLVKEMDGGTVSYGYCASPAVTDKVVVVVLFDKKSEKDKKPEDGDHGPYRGYGGSLLALNRKTGEQVWRNTDFSASPWSSPMVATLDGRETIIHDTGRTLFGVNPEDGKTLWKFDFRTVHPEGRNRGGPMAASPAVTNDGKVIFMINGQHCVVCFEIKDNTVKPLWRQTAVMHWFQSVAVYDGCVYVPYIGKKSWTKDYQPNFYCLDLETGKVLWDTDELLAEHPEKRKRMRGQRSHHGSTFLVAGGKAVLVTPKGLLVSAEVSAKGHKLLSRIDVLPKDTMRYSYEAHPILANGYLYCRAGEHILCFDVRETH